MIGLALVLACLLVVGCGGDSRSADGGPSADAGGGADAGSSVEAGGPDGGSPVDASVATDAGGADTWETFAMGFFSSYCVECHSGGSRDYTAIDHVSRDAAEIRCGVATTALSGCGSFPPPRQFPVGTGAKPSDEERERLVAWIDAGLP